MRRFAKAQLKATEYEAGNRHEQYSGESQRRRVALSGAGWGAASASTGLASAGLAAHRVAGRPAGQASLKALAAKHPQYKDPIKRFAARSVKVAAKPKTALAATAGLGAAGAATGMVARFRRNEEQGISQGIGRIKAGAQYDRDLSRIGKLYAEENGREWRDDDGNRGRGRYPIPGQAKRVKTFTVGKSLMGNLGMVGSLSQDPATKRALALAVKHRKPLGIGAAITAGTGATAYGARAGTKRKTEVEATRAALRALPVSKGASRADAVRWGAGIVGLGSLGGATTYGATKDKHTAERAVAGGLAGQGAYQAVGYGLKHRADRQTPAWQRLGVKRSEVPKEHKKEFDALSRERRAHYDRYEGAARHRNTPAHWPGAKARRAVGWTHGGKVGEALGLGATLGGSQLAAGRRQKVGKSQYGYREKKVSPLRAAEGAAGLAVGAWGVSRLKMLGPMAAYGARVATKHGGGKEAQAALQLAERVGRATRDVTGAGERQLRQYESIGRAIDRVPEALRPGVATAAGALLVANARPISQDRFTPVRSW